MPKQREFVKIVAGNTESALRAANKFGKSTITAFLVIAFLRGLRQFCGVTLPRFRQPARWWALTRTYKQQVEGTQAAIAMALGEWPHEIAWENRAEGIWAGVRIKPDGWASDDPQTWAWLAFVSQQNSRNDADIAKGARLDGCWFDEPGYAAVMRELRKAGRPGEVFRIVHSFTPIHLREWEAIRDDIERHHSHIAEVVAEIYDAERGRVENGFLTRAEIEELEKLYRGDPHVYARLRAIYCDTTSSCPFDAPSLVEMRDNCAPGTTHYADERNGVMYLRDHPQGQIQVWGRPAPQDRVLVLANPSAGVPPGEGEKGSHLANLTAISIVQRRTLLRWAGYLTPPEMALMARAVTNGYRSSIFVPEMNGGWGEELLRSFLAAEAAPDTNCLIYQDVDPTSTVGNAKTRAGWWQTSVRRNALISALQRAILERSLGMPCEDQIDNLLAVTRDGLGRYDDPENGEHPRDFIVLGMGCSIMENPGIMPAQFVAQEDETDRERFYRKHHIARPEDSYDGYAPETTRWR